MYDNYVFDLYGTLIDIHTDESGEAFWRSIAELYSCAGIGFTPAELQKSISCFAPKRSVRSRLKQDTPIPR